MPKRYQDPSLLWLAVVGMVLYLGVTFLTPFMEQDKQMEEQPQAPTLSKQQATEAAAAFAKKMLSLMEPYDTSTYYQSHTVRSGYLQREKLTEAYEKQFGDRLPIDYYEVEIGEQATGTTYFVDVDYHKGNVLAWQTVRTASSKSKTVSAAAAPSDQFIGSTFAEQGYVFSDFTLKDGKPAASGELVYEHKQWRIGEAPFRIAVKASGELVSHFKPGFAVPDTFISWQEAQDRQSGWMTWISMGVSSLMTLASLIVIIKYRREITLSRGLIMSIAFAAIYIMNNFNMIPAVRSQHGAAPSGDGIGFYLWIINIFVVLVALSAYFAFVAGHRLWVRKGWNPWPTWRDAEFGGHVHTAMVRGYLICLFILGVQQVLFFVAMEGFDVWAVSDPADSVFNMTYPALFPLMAWAAAISEEAVYRLFGIALFWKLTRSKFLAVLIPSMIWAMSHTQYPIYPVYTRFVEVTIIGLIFGYMFLKYGFLTAMFAHAAMDSILMGLSLMYMGQPSQVLAGAAYLLVPALVGWLLSWLHRRFKRRPPAPGNPAAPLRNPDPDSDRLAPV